MSFSHQDLLILQDAYSEYDANSDYFISGSVTKANAFVHSIMRILRYPEQVHKDNERAIWNHGHLLKQMEDAKEFVSFSQLGSSIHYSEWCRF